MGNYNPHAPRILGEEWVPIRDEDLVYSPGVNVVELGTTYKQTAIRQVRDARFYTNQLPGAFASSQCGLVSIYPAGLEDQTGPIRQVIIPCNSANVTGANISLFNGAVSYVDAVAQPSDAKAIEFDYNSGTPQRAEFFFAVNSYPELSNKRILNVSLLYSGWVSDQDPDTGASIDFINPTPATTMTLIRQRNDTGSAQEFTAPGSGFLSNTGTLSALGTTVNNPLHTALGSAVIGVVDMGDINNFWNPALAPTAADKSRMPWRYVDLQRFEASAANRQRVWLQVQMPATARTAIVSTSPSMFLDYMALRVIYCEEKRVAYGGKLFTYAYGMNSITMRDLSHNADPILPAGTYLPTLSWVSPGTIDFGVAVHGQFPKVNALRELYQIPSHVTTQVNVPFPLADRLGDTFTSEVIHAKIPQLSLHASGGTLTEPHVYGRQAAAQVYGSNTATQDIYDDISGVAATYPWVRFYARRFGDTTIPLTLTGVGGLSGSSVSITPSDFDALDEILDGWKEVTLRFSTPPSMGAVGGFPAWTWSAVGETAGNRWEVLGLAAPAISGGVPGSLLTQVPAPNQLGTATYQPTSGDTVELTWMPQGINGPWVTGSATDAASDAVLIFSQDMPAVSGFTVTTLSQAVSGIGQQCGIDPCCIPTAILYNQLTWTAGPAEGLSLPGTSGSIASTPDNAALDITGDIDLRIDVTMDDWTPTSESSLISKFFFAQASYSLDITPTGLVMLSWSTDGSAVLNRTSTVAPVVANGTRLAIRATLDVDNGAAGHTVVFYTAPTLAGPFTQLGASVITAGVTSIHSGTAALDIGGPAGVIDLWPGTVHAALVLNGISGTTVASPNFAAQAPGTTSFTDSAGRVWSVSGDAAIVGFSDDSIEIQRQDTVETEWKTIMLSSGTGVSSFRDYEARVGIQSSYRIRGVNVYDFPGPWSSTVTTTIPTPGISGGCVSDGHILIFTTNEDQDGSLNLAYSSVWMDGQVTEDFNFPEAGFVQLQAMYDRDFYVAFRPLERGGEQFSRTVLVQAAAIAPETLADFQSLRDMAWSTVNYICVRDEDGNRWLATVAVPSGRVLNNRRLYLAPVNIVEVTDTPTPVDPNT